MRKTTIVLTLLLAACSKAENDASRQSEPTASGSLENASGPDVAPTALAGVAINYSYALRLPISKLAATQEQHAAQCEALGPSRCRIVGMRYHVDPGRWVSGSLSVKLAPEIARNYGKQGIATAVANGGMLMDSEINSTDAGVTVAASRKANESVVAEQSRIQLQLTQQGLSSTERSQLQARLSELADRSRNIAAQKDDAALLLASTPLTFTYSSGMIDRSLGDGPFIGAAKDGWANLLGGAATLVTILITLLPWAVAGSLILWLWRRYLRRWLKSNDEG